MVNKVILIGNVGQDPEVKDTQAGMIAHCSLATSEKYKDKLGSGTTHTKTEWHRLTFYKPLSDVVNQYVHKGDTIYVEGKLSYSEYTDKDGNKKQSTEIQVRELKMLSKKGENQSKLQGQGQPQNFNYTTPTPPIENIEPNTEDLPF